MSGVAGYERREGSASRSRVGVLSSQLSLSPSLPTAASEKDAALAAVPSDAPTMMASHEELSQINISKEEKDKLVAEVIRYVLFKTHQGFGCPIKREELTQLITKSYRQRSLPALVINEAREKISTVFGYEMKELQRSRASGTRQNCASQQSAAEAKSYVLVSQLPSDIYKKYIEDKGASHIYGFTFVVISIVYLAGGKLSEENLWHHLRRLGLSVSDESHPVFGSTKQKLDLLVQQRFLQKEIANDAGGKVVMYELAERALEESVNDKLKDYIAQAMLIGLLCCPKMDTWLETVRESLDVIKKYR